MALALDLHRERVGRPSVLGAPLRVAEAQLGIVELVEEVAVVLP